jgi:hypothetical protein
VATGFQKPGLLANARRAKYRVPDQLGSPSAEIRRLIPTYQKREGARTIAPHLDLTHNNSNSFRVLMRSIQELTQA